MVDYITGGERGMSELFSEYFSLVHDYVPLSAYLSLLVVFLIGSMVLLATCGLKKGLRNSLVLLLVEYIMLLFFQMVAFRPLMKTSALCLQPFWSYRAIQEGKGILLPEIIMNVVVFLPVGFLLGGAFQKMKWWMVLLIGLCVSVAIEALQFIYQRGLSEVDDVIHNVVGCLVGFGIFFMCASLLKRVNLKLPKEEKSR